MDPEGAVTDPMDESGLAGRDRGGSGYPSTDLAWALLIAREILALIFFMAGVWKVFELGPLVHARDLFVEPYADTFLPAWSLWLTGALVPVVELVAGGLLLVGFRRRESLLALGGVLVLVTFGHLLAEPLYSFSGHVIPRTALLLFVLTLLRHDRFSVDAWLAARSREGS